MHVNGSCHCGGITYEAYVNPAHLVVCHCTDCRALSGTAFRVVVAATPGTFRLIRGEPKTYVKIGASGNPREQTLPGIANLSDACTRSYRRPSPRACRREPAEPAWLQAISPL